ncbi:velvet factor-domain-containing protein [Halenospora varia]|nr:velvet factor-domain-containing protein [Halenospora varia]
MPNIHEAAYHAGVPGRNHYAVSRAMPLPPHSQMAYSDPYAPMAGTRPPVPEQMHVSEGLAPLAPGTQPAIADPMPRSMVDENGRKYEVLVVQQPQRARMCGFGDKDRRPITPPPCIRLIVTDIKTGKEVDCNDIDHGMFVINVDLWSADGAKEVNLVRHSQTSPSIGLTTPVSFNSAAQSAPAYSQILPGSLQGMRGEPIKYEHGQAYQSSAYSQYPNQPQVNPYAQPPQQYGGGPPYTSYAPTSNGAPYPPQNGYSQPGQQSMYFASGAQGHASQGIDYNSPPQAIPSQELSYGGRPYAPEAGMPRVPVTSTSSPGGMFTRNLIGSLSASAFRLTDPDDRIAIWFILQDLSVRTEGTFRLRFSFVNVGVPTTSPNSNGSLQVNQGKAPVLAACFSEPFTVYSAKRFPGVVESTNLSKCFATQGIKIPIRKDGQGPSRANLDKEYDED